MILDAAEAVLGYFGFDRTIYGNKKNSSTMKWIEDSFRWFRLAHLRLESDCTYYIYVIRILRPETILIWDQSDANEN